jgi:glycine betaine/proline transport system substrate-binding protein
MTSCISGWTCYTVNLVKQIEYGLDKYYTNFDPGSGGALDAAIAGAFAKKKPIFTYYWAPTGLMGKVDLVRLTEPKFDSDCWNKMSAVVEDIKANGPDAYKKSCACEYRDMALTKSVLTDWAKANPAETAFLEKYTIPTAVVNKMLAFYEDESDGDMELTAKEFLKTEAMWKSWVPADVAKKVSAAL